jgi:aryl-alcohol dehydrogenase-like predicted oxidoreductase
LLIRELEKLVHDGLVEKIGVSVYTADQIDRALAKFNFQILQAPLNVFDQRLIESGHLSVLKQKNIEVHARSLFLQGLLLMEESEVGEMFPAIISHFHEYRAYLTRQGLTPLEGALAFARQVKEVDTVIVGVCSRDQLESILRAWNKVTARIDFRPFSLRNDKIVDPRFWEAKR